MADFPDYFKRDVDLRISSNTPVYSSESQGLVQRKRRLPSQRWEFLLTGHVFSDNYKKFDAFLYSLNGSYNTFTWRIPTHNTAPDGLNTTTIIADSLKGSSTVYATRNSLLTVDDAGFFVRLFGGTKVYMVTKVEKENINGLPADKLTIFPQLRNDHFIGNTIDYQPKFTVRLRDNISTGTMSANFRFKVYSLDLVEVL